MKQHFTPLVVLAMAIAPRAAPGDCSVTLPASSPVEVPGSSSNDRYAWYGSDALAVRLPADGRWRGMGPSHNFRDKFWIWRRGYEATSEPRPALTFAGMKPGNHDKPRRLNVDRATNAAFGPGKDQMLIGMEFPSAGCWRVTVQYMYAGITQELTFIVDVIDE